MVDTRRTGNSKPKANGCSGAGKSRGSLNGSGDRYGESSDQEGSDYTPEQVSRKNRRPRKDSHNLRSSDGDDNHQTYKKKHTSGRNSSTRESRTSSRHRAINYNEESTDGEDCIVGLNGSKKKLDSGLDESTKSDDREDPSSPKLMAASSSKEEEEDDETGVLQMAEEDGEVEDREIEEEGDEDMEGETKEVEPVIELDDDCSMDNNNIVKVEPVNEESCDRPRKRRRAEVEDLLRSQGRDPSEAANLNTGPEIYHNIKSRTRQKKLFFDDDQMSDRCPPTDQDNDNESSQNEDDDDDDDDDDEDASDHRTSLKTHGLRRSKRKRNRRYGEDPDADVPLNDQDEDEGNEPHKKNYFLRKRKPVRSQIYQGYYQQDDDERYMRRNRTRYHHNRPRGSPHKNRDVRSDSDDGARMRRNEEEAKARCVPINFTAADIQMRGLENPTAATSNGKGNEIGEVVCLDPSITFASIGGLADVLKKLTETVRFPNQYPEFFEKFGLKPQKGLLFHGLPGTGKTHVARALANESKKGQEKPTAFIPVKGSDMMSKWFGDSERHIRALFARAIELKPSIIFFDEIDGIAPRRSNNQESDGNAYNSLVSALLTQMDGLKPSDGVLVIGATNRVDAIDPALRRPGRFDREFYFPLPNKEARRSILKIHTSTWKPGMSNRLLEWLSENTSNYCGADIKGLCTEAALISFKEEFPQVYESVDKLKITVEDIVVRQKHFMKAMKLVTPATQRFEAGKTRPLNVRLSPLLTRSVKILLVQYARIYPDIKKKSKTLREEGANLKTTFETQVFSIRCSSLQDNQLSTAVDMNDTDSDDFSSDDEDEDDQSCEFDGHNSEYLLSELSVYRPRMLMFGGPGSALVSDIAPAFLNDLEGVRVHMLNTTGIFGGVVTNSQEHGVKEIIRLAVKTSPSVIYMPDLENFLDLSSDSLLSVFENELNSIPSHLPVLLLGACQRTKPRDVSDTMARFFPPMYREDFETTKPIKEERKKFFEPIFMVLAKRKPRIRALRKLKKSRVVLEKVSPEPSKVSQELLVQTVKKEEATLLKQRQFLRKFLQIFTSDSGFKHFRYPVIEREVPDYYKVIKDPMDFDTMTRKIDQGCYWNNEAFLEDIDLICKNAIEYNPRGDSHGLSIIHSASVLGDTARDEMNSKSQTDLEKACEWVISSRTNRGIKIHTPTQYLHTDSIGGGEQLNLDSSAGSIPLMPRAKRPRRSKWSKGIIPSVKRRSKITNGDSRKSSDLHPDMECSVDPHDLFDNNTGDCNTRQDGGEETEFDNSLGSFTDFPLKNDDHDDKNVSLTAQCGDESTLDPHELTFNDESSSLDARIMEDHPLPKSELISEETRGYGLANNEESNHSRCNEDDKEADGAVKEEYADDGMQLEEEAAAAADDDNMEEAMETNEVVKEDVSKDEEDTAGVNDAKDGTEEEQTHVDAEEDDLKRKKAKSPPPIPQPPPMIIDDQKLEELLDLCVEKTPDLNVEELEQIFAHSCRIVVRHKKKFDKTELLQDLEEMIMSLTEQEADSSTSL